MTDVVAIYNSSFRQILQTARPARANVMESATLPVHPLEDGSSINDHKIINPVTVEVTFFLDASELSNTYQIIRQLYLSNDLVTVQTRTGSYSNMTIESMPHDETSDILDSAFLVVKFYETVQTKAQFGPLPPSSVRRPAQASTQDRGEQLPGAENSQGSFLYRTFIE